ncbi:hypothetical protein DM02DRAFT_725421 [Periconia macrospinosa]|uniref:Uncharacterized protein n=1 Tax=Periconia macrospinosa TaxID=97972 RepID=A0A2V1E4C9_9PLEO|nr:hypothetical protein DM02DRAFT_725421 [Periconia macrospinosa]
MRPSLLLPLNFLFLLPTTTATPNPTPSLPSAPTWPEKLKQLSTHLRTIGTAVGKPGFGYGEFINLTFADGDCHQIRLYNWDCSSAIPYKLPNIADWLDRSNFGAQNRTRFENTFEDQRYFEQGWYRDPEDGFHYYDVARFTWGQCGNRGPQSACGHVYCVLEDGTTAGASGTVPQGETPWMDPNDRNRLCRWLRGDCIAVYGEVSSSVGRGKEYA